MEHHNQPIIFVVGCTGTGKSKLGVQLAEIFNGEVISADSIQVYKGLDIASNKLTTNEMKGIPHHLISILEKTETFNSSIFVRLTEQLIEDIRNRNRIPIIVGGTHNYIEALLYRQHLESSECPSLDTDQSTTKEDNDYSYDKLKEVDPIICEKLHPNDTRKIKRYLDIYYTTGSKPSDMFLNNPTTIKRMKAMMIWIHCDKDTLNSRLDNRIDDMVSSGLIKEIVDTHNELKSLGMEELDVTNGMLQSIGFKEFYDYLKYIENNNDKDDQADKILKECIQKLKNHTHRYANNQYGWIKRLIEKCKYYNESLEIPTNDDHEIYKVDSTDLSKWEDCVLRPSIRLCSKVLSKSIEPNVVASFELVNLASTPPQKTIGIKEWKKFKCDTCNGRVINGQVELEAHLRSKSHRAHVRKLKRQQNQKEEKEKEEPNDDNHNDTT